jgi:hypothetical protein
MAALTKNFHNLVDTHARAFQTYTIGGVWKNIPPYIILRDRSVTYQFFAHFHPYVGGNRSALPKVPSAQLSLIRRLNDGGVPELQDSDTLYMPQPNPANNPVPLAVLPNSTRATLIANVAGGTRPNGTIVALSAGTPLTLPDTVNGTPVNTTVNIAIGTTVAHPDGTTSQTTAPLSFSLPGHIPVSSFSGIQFSADSILPDYTGVTISMPAGVYAVLTNDGSQVHLPAGTQVSIRSGLPQPFFFESIFDSSHYNPNKTNVTEPYPAKNLDFTYNGAYSIYNWEIFFHAPLLIAVHLSQNQQFQDAQNWFHYIFKPTDNSPGPTPERFWKVQPFQYTDVQMIQDILVNLSTGQDVPLQTQTIQSISDWMQNPFQPWAVAKYRPTAYMLKTVMAYLDNLIAWGDSLFQQYTIETINEATQIYIMAANILGTKPQAVPVKGSVKSLSYNQLRGKLDAFGNALVDMEVDMPFDLVASSGSGATTNGMQILESIGQTLYFCIPRNDQLLAYWDTVADRLFKIHNSLTLQGVFRRLPLYEPPIDPALLVRAAASGLDVSAIVSGLNQPLPLVRFQVLVGKATEICQEVKSLGANLLAAIEKQDNESLCLLRSQHENAIVQLAEMVKYAQWQDAQKATQALQLSLATATQRYAYYQKLLGRKDGQIQNSIPQLDALDLGSLENLNFSQSEPSSEPAMGLDPINPDIAQNSLAVSDGELATISNHEASEILKLQDGQSSQGTAATWDKIGAVAAVVPDFGAFATPIGVGANVTFGGHNVASVAQAFSTFNKSDAEQSNYEAASSAKLGSYSRREQEWIFQSNSAKSEINQILKQIRGAQIREAIAKKEYENHQVQMQNAQQIVDFLQGNDIGGGFQTKETTIGFYAWMKREVKGLYAKAFQLAYEVAKKAERALQNELGDPSLSYIQYNYLDGREGLLAGEKLLFDVKAMEMAYHDLNQREYELTKHVSLLQVDPLALVQLRATGTCSFTLSEDAFDLDCPGHYFRRIKSVALTLPCVAGPYTSVNCTLTLQKSTIRVSTDVPNGKYARQGSDDTRFNDYYGTVQSIVTSSAQSDSALFETNLRDERYLPFEGSGVAGSQWQLTLPSDVPQFDFDTITDVVLHVRYTAREGGDALEAAAVNNLQALISKAQTVGSVCLFSVRHEFPSQWAKFQSVTISGSTPTAELQLTLVPELYPFWAQAVVGGKSPKPVSVKGVQFFAEMPPGDTTVAVNMNDKPDKSGNNDALVKNPLLGNLLSGALNKIALPAAITDATHPPLMLYFDNNSMKDLWLAVTWGKS